MDEEKSVGVDNKSALNSSKKSGALPSPPVEFKDPPSSCKTQNAPSLAKEKKETKSKFHQTNETLIRGTDEHTHPNVRCGECMCVKVCKCKILTENKDSHGGKTGSN